MKEEPYKTTKYRGFNINFYQDLNAENPREAWDNLCTMVCWHRRYDLGDKHKFTDPEHFDNWLKDQGYIPGKNIFMLPLYLYDHSGITMRTHSFSCKWDSGQVGWIYITAERYRAECFRPGKLSKDGINHGLHTIKHITVKDRQHINELLKGEVETYDQYLTGEVYGYRIEPTDKNRGIGLSSDCLESCWGFYGDEGIKDAVNDAKSDIRYSIKKYHAEIVVQWLEKKQLDHFMNTCWAF